MAMSPEARSCYNAYMRNWRKKNKARSREGRESYWERKAQEEARKKEAEEALKNEEEYLK